MRLTQIKSVIRGVAREGALTGPAATCGRFSDPPPTLVLGDEPSALGVAHDAQHGLGKLRILQERFGSGRAAGPRPTCSLAGGRWGAPIHE